MSKEAPVRMHSYHPLSPTVAAGGFRRDGAPINGV